MVLSGKVALYAPTVTLIQFRAAMTVNITSVSLFRKSGMVWVLKEMRSRYISRQSSNVRAYIRPTMKWPTVAHRDADSNGSAQDRGSMASKVPGPVSACVP